MDPLRVYAGCEEDNVGGELPLELVLKKYVEINPAREMRCFVRNNVLIGMYPCCDVPLADVWVTLGVSQRDTNYYEHLQSADNQETICDTIRSFWEDEILNTYSGGADCPSFLDVTFLLLKYDRHIRPLLILQ